MGPKIGSPGAAAFSSMRICLSSLSISSQLPKMSSSTVGMFELCDLVFGCWRLVMVSHLAGDPPLENFHLWCSFSSRRTFPWNLWQLRGGRRNDEAVKRAATREHSPWLETTREAPTPSPKIIWVWGAKNEPKTSPMYLLALIMTIFPFLFCWWKRCRVSKACNWGASRLGEAWPRPRLGRKTYWHKDKARLTGTRNYIKLLKSQQGWTWRSW